MSNAAEIITAIDTFLDKFSLKKNKLEDKDLISFIEEKWAQADDGKYEIHMGSIIIGRMINEYIAVKDFENMKRWLEMSDRHSLSKKNPAYINNYYNGDCCLECGQEEEALKYLRLCYEENPEYIFTGGAGCIGFFNKHLEHPVMLSKDNTEEEEDFTDFIELKGWQAFFQEDTSEFQYDLIGDKPIKKASANHKRGLAYIADNQSKILEVILTGLLEQYPTLQNEYGYSCSDKQDFMPDVMAIKDFADLLSPVGIHIFSVYQDKFPYIGYEFSCSWDTEHGLGFMMFQNRIIEIGGADTSFLSWIAKADLKQQKNIS
ncbi:DUF6985 domain-containing protein [Pedobacter cryoconitis]|uniref:DUF6985 domain-containing protein n=1 Tax=Pedobacter cryoconitis TaxID=188932 RepID=A0A327SUU0_9SPHI|nr:hypothetical protein [Pedobacter cryoconitis]RAJ33070.1 hypothetical protein LY11_01760 [Pedobacter cryoconitis]